MCDYRSEDYRQIAAELNLVYDTMGGQHTLDAFALLKAVLDRSFAFGESIAAPEYLDSGRARGKVTVRIR